MLVLLSFGLVLIATVLLVLGLLVGDGLSLIYASIALSAVAAVILFVAVRVSKPKVAQAAGPAPLVPDREPEPEYATAGAPATTTMPAVAPVAAQAPTATTPVAPAPVPDAEEAEADPDSGAWLAADQEWEEPAAEWEEDDLEFPIADYDELTEDEILPLLPQLYSDEIDIVQERERKGQARFAVIETLDRLRAGSMSNGHGSAAGAAPAKSSPNGRHAADDVIDLADNDDDDDDVIDLADTDEDDWDADVFPIEDYDELALGDIYSLLDELDDEELVMVREHEAANKSRSTLLTNLDRRLGNERAASQTRRSPVKVAPAPIKRAPARAKKAAPAQRTAAARKPSTTKTQAAKKATPVKKTTQAKRTTARKPTAKKAAPARRTTRRS